MTAKPDFMMQPYIRCTHDALWDALRDPEAISAYHFLSDRISLENRAYTYRTPDGDAMLVQRGLREDPKSRIDLSFEIQGPDAAPASRSVYLLSAEDAGMKLVIEHYELFHPVVPGEGVHDGWTRFATGLKAFLEAGEVTQTQDQGASA